jgi:glycyl-tRNA synthetase
VDYDTSGSIGRRYRRNDEVGTPYCVTIDYETLEQGTVTIRDRDSMKQVKLDAQRLIGVLEELLAGDRKFLDAGVPVEALAAKEQ